MTHTLRLGPTEKQFSQQVVDLARTLGWKCYRTFNSRFSPAGYPDLTMVRGNRIIFAELKVGKNFPSVAQGCWLSALAESGVGEVYIWWPESLETEIMGVLR